MSALSELEGSMLRSETAHKAPGPALTLLLSDCYYQVFDAEAPFK
jgi:hypothetical protein